MGTQREASASALPLQCVAHFETLTFRLTTALQRKIVYATGRCPPICRLVFWYTSFHIWHCKLHMNDEISVLGELAIMRHDFDSLASGLREQHAVDRV